MKKRWRLFWFGILALTALAAPMVASRLPHPQKDLLEPEPPAFSGVVDIWVLDGFPGAKAQISGWLGGRFAEFEKPRKGTLIHLREMSAASAEGYINSGIRPDAIVFPLGAALDLSEALRPLALDAAVHPALQKSARYRGQTVVAPLAMGGYALMGNEKRMAEKKIDPDLPWRQKIESLHGQGGRKSTPWYAIQCPKPALGDPLAALCDMAGGASFYDESPAAAMPEDLGAVAADRAWSDFVMDGKYGLYVCTQREVGRIQALVAGGRDFEWSLEDVSSYTDQVWLLGLPAGGEDPVRQSLLDALCAHLQAQPSQEKLALAGFFSVRADIPALYEGAAGLDRMEAALRGDLRVPSVFAVRPLAGDGDARKRLTASLSWLSGLE